MSRDVKNWKDCWHDEEGHFVPATGDCESCGAPLVFDHDPVYCTECTAVYNGGGTRLVDPSLWEEPWDEDY